MTVIARSDADRDAWNAKARAENQEIRVHDRAFRRKRLRAFVDQQSPVIPERPEVGWAVGYQREGRAVTTRTNL